ncbi:hypothetical protein MSG28_013056 [Choristoneura fumiferana]|uniref:Uncharacterized protein n=1 Tax=Choristoneura fumiferana TaxID=7141 RepID=A0ACC0KS42_CHOFU|nr:hypothetical protein MSG28_013056 [Choristoneura fumiferana]
MKMSLTIINKSKMIAEMMRFSFHHRAFYCYVGMSIWICFLITVMYKYISVGEETTAIKKIVQNEYISKRAVDSETWLLQGVLVATRHGDRGPLTHLRGGDRLPCDTVPVSQRLTMYVTFQGIKRSSG